jgi:hypothetical protein
MDVSVSLQATMTTVAICTQIHHGPTRYARAQSPLLHRLCEVTDELIVRNVKVRAGGRREEETGLDEGVGRAGSPHRRCSYMSWSSTHMYSVCSS